MVCCGALQHSQGVGYATTHAYTPEGYQLHCEYKGGAGLRSFSSEEVVLQPARWVDRHQVGCAGCIALHWGVADRTEIGALRDRTQRLMACSGRVDVHFDRRTCWGAWRQSASHVSKTARLLFDLDR